MVESLNVPVTVVKIETVRDADGLAHSSRNALLTPEERAHAPQFYRTLSKAAQILKVEPQGVLGTLATAKETLEATGFVVQYLALVDPRTMSEILLPQPDSRIVAAVTCGRVRLIDNVCV